MVFDMSVLLVFFIYDAQRFRDYHDLHHESYLDGFFRVGKGVVLLPPWPVARQPH